MFTSVKNPFQKKSFLSLLEFISKQANYTASAPKEKVDKLIAADPSLMVITGADPTNAKNVIVQLTPAGVAGVQSLTPADLAPVVRAAAPTEFGFGTLGDLPETRRGGPKTESYPFEKLAAPAPILDVNGVATGKFNYAYFSVPATDSRPNPVKSLQSTANSATKRYSKTDDKRKFVVRPQLANDGSGKVIGALIVRSA